MPINTGGDGYGGPVRFYAGRYANGTILIDSGIYYTQYVEIGKPIPDSTPTTATLTVTGGQSSLIVQNPDTPGALANIDVGYNNSGGAGYLEIQDGASVSSINNGYYTPGQNGDPGTITGGFNNLRVGFGTNTYGKVTVDGAGSTLTIDGLAARAVFGRYGGEGRLEVTGGATATFNATTVERLYDSAYGVAGTLAGGYNNLFIGFEGGHWLCPCIRDRLDSHR